MFDKYRDSLTYSEDECNQPISTQPSAYWLTQTNEHLRARLSAPHFQSGNHTQTPGTHRGEGVAGVEIYEVEKEMSIVGLSRHYQITPALLPGHIYTDQLKHKQR